MGGKKKKVYFEKRVSEELQGKLKEAVALLPPKTSTYVSKYPEEVKMTALSLRASGYTYEGIAEILRVSSATVHEWVNRLDVDEVEYASLAQAIKRQLANKTYVLANGILSAITDEDMRKASLLQKTTAACQMVDKGRLIQDKSTQNISYQGRSRVIHHIESRIDSMLSKEDKLKAEAARLNQYEQEAEEYGIGMDD